MPDKEPDVVARAPKAAAPPTKASAPGVAASSDPSAGSRELMRVADQLLPRIITRFTASKLGELEIRHGEWRVRLRRAATAADPIHHVGEPHGSKDGRDGRAGGHAGGVSPTSGASLGDPSRILITSPAVGYFLPIEGREVGRAVKSGETLAYVEMLGVRHDVVSSADGVFGQLMAEPGQAVEYGQGLVRIERPVESADRSATHTGHDA